MKYVPTARKIEINENKENVDITHENVDQRETLKY
jgi:hypothetical protein